jgi:hypothetical protein
MLTLLDILISQNDLEVLDQSFIYQSSDLRFQVCDNVDQAMKAVDEMQPSKRGICADCLLSALTFR